MCRASVRRSIGYSVCRLSRRSDAMWQALWLLCLPPEEWLADASAMAVAADTAKKKKKSRETMRKITRLLNRVSDILATSPNVFLLGSDQTWSQMTALPSSVTYCEVIVMWASKGHFASKQRTTNSERLWDDVTTITADTTHSCRHGRRRKLD